MFCALNGSLTGKMNHTLHTHKYVWVRSISPITPVDIDPPTQKNKNKNKNNNKKQQQHNVVPHLLIISMLKMLTLFAGLVHQDKK